jgi:hypothetical protein
MKTFRLQKVSLMKAAKKAGLSGILSDVYPSKFCLKREDVSALFRFKCALGYGIREFPANEESLN